MTLVRTSLLNGVAVAVKVMAAMALNKILAIYVGPAGYGIIGQFQNALAVIVNLAGGVVATGVTKATAEHYDDTARQHGVWRTAIRLSLAASVLAGVVLLVLRSHLSEALLHNAGLASVFVALALTLPATAANNILLAVVNGKKEVGIYITANIIGSLITLTVTGLLAWQFGLYGALVACAIAPSLALLSTAAMVLRRSWLSLGALWGPVDKAALKELSGFALMGITAALATPIALMLIRQYVADTLGLPAAGYWQASWKISEIYLMLVTTTLTLYYVPRLAEIRHGRELRQEVWKVYRFVMPVVLVGATVIYVLRDFITQLLFSADFRPMEALFSWQLTGDVIKIGSWVLSCIMLGRSMVKAYIATEIIFSASFVLLSWLYVRHFGLTGVPMAYVTNYVLYWIVIGLLVRRKLSN
jgi:PST family polysaccharide transporter